MNDKMILLVTLLFLSCNKGSDEKPTVKLVIGNSYSIKSGVFNTGTYQPVCPCRLDKLYTDSFGVYKADINDQNNVEWHLPQWDLK